MFIKNVTEMFSQNWTSSSAMAETVCELSDFNGVGHFEAKF